MERCENEVNKITYGDIDARELETMFATMFKIRENLQAGLDASSTDAGSVVRIAG